MNMNDVTQQETDAEKFVKMVSEKDMLPIPKCREAKVQPEDGLHWSPIYHKGDRFYQRREDGYLVEGYRFPDGSIVKVRQHDESDFLNKEVTLAGTDKQGKAYPEKWVRAGSALNKDREPKGNERNNGRKRKPWGFMARYTLH